MLAIERTNRIKGEETKAQAIERVIRKLLNRALSERVEAGAVGKGTSQSELDGSSGTPRRGRQYRRTQGCCLGQLVDV